MVALLAAPVVEQRFDASGDAWNLDDLDKQLGGYFADRDPAVGFAADSVMQLIDLDKLDHRRNDHGSSGRQGRHRHRRRAGTGRRDRARLRRGGRAVVIADIAEEAGEALADELGERGAAYFRRHDVSDEASWTALVEEANERFGPVNVLVNNAGILRFGEVEKMPVEEFELLFRVNQLGCFLGMKSVARTMRKNGGGSIVNASSIEGLGGMGSLCRRTAAPSSRSAA